MNLAGLLISYAFIISVLLLVNLSAKKNIVKQNVARKIIHIGVCHWWLIAFTMMDSMIWALIGPVSFIIINFLIARYDLIPGMNSSNGRNYGTVYFPVTLVLLVLAVYQLGVSPFIAGIGVMIMGWGDGMASLIGENLKSPDIHIWGNRKSLAGSLSMLVFSFAVAVAGLLWGGFGSLSFILAAAIAAAACGTFFELVTPFGLDNITVPVAVTILLNWMAG